MSVRGESCYRHLYEYVLKWSYRELRICSFVCVRVYVRERERAQDYNVAQARIIGMRAISKRKKKRKRVKVSSELFFVVGRA